MVLITFLFLYILGNIIYNVVNRPISNIYISGNYYLSDWEVIELASLDNYPSTLVNTSSVIKKKLEKQELISKVTIKKKWLSIVYIEVIENRPLFYSQISKKTILMDKKQVDKEYDVPILNSAIPEEKYDDFIRAMADIPIDVLNRMSEITHSPDEVDDERYLITMTDGNYVYVTLKKFNAINSYNDYVKEFNNKKGVLFLNSGEYFKIMEN